MIAMNFSKKLLRVVSALLLTALSFMFIYGCDNTESEEIPVTVGFSVHFIDVGNGDSIFVRLPDGKNMLIDCGANQNDNLQNIKRVLDTYSVKTIDYLVLTHPDIDHVGNAESIIKSYQVKRAYIPNVYNIEEYPRFDKAVDALRESSAEIKYSSLGDGVLQDDYVIAFLSPCSSSLGDPYGDFNKTPTPTDSEINDLSPIIYLEYANVKFLFTGDAGVNQERLVLTNYEVGLYTQAFYGRVNLSNIDFLKVAHHGANGSTSKDLLDEIMPTNAIISVGGDNVYGHPSSVILNRLYENNENMNVLRTDVYGNISVSVDEDGQYQINK